MPTRTGGQQRQPQETRSLVTGAEVHVDLGIFAKSPSLPMLARAWYSCPVERGGAPHTDTQEITFPETAKKSLSKHQVAPSEVCGKEPMSIWGRDYGTKAKAGLQHRYQAFPSSFALQQGGVVQISFFFFFYFFPFLNPSWIF